MSFIFWLRCWYWWEKIFLMFVRLVFQESVSQKIYIYLYGGWVYLSSCLPGPAKVGYLCIGYDVLFLVRLILCWLPSFYGHPKNLRPRPSLFSHLLHGYSGDFFFFFFLVDKLLVLSRVENFWTLFIYCDDYFMPIFCTLVGFYHQ